MQEVVEFNNLAMSKAEVVAMITNIMIDELIIRSSRHQQVCDYYDLAVIGYHGDNVTNLLTERKIEFTSITDLAQRCPTEHSYSFKQLTNSGDTIFARFLTHDWIHPMAEGKTPMYEALIEVYHLVNEWCFKHENHNSFPPIIFHITDGSATDGKPVDLISIANSIKQTQTADGNTLLVNVHIGSGHEYCQRGVLFPGAIDELHTSEQMATLFAMSSDVPDALLHQLPVDIIDTTHQPRLVAYNISPCELLNIINIGSESVDG
jgi:hypothetical protein